MVLKDKPALCNLHGRERLPAVAQSSTTTLSSTAYVNMSVMYVLP